MKSDDSDLRTFVPVPMWRRFGCRAFAITGFIALFTVVALLAQQGPGSASEASSSLLPANVASAPSFGMCPAQPSVESVPLRWSASPTIADRICCQNHDYAESWGYWTSTTFPRDLPAGVSNITFFDVVTQKPLFVAPVGRTYAEFYEESLHHGWPSFRDAEVVKENVKHTWSGETLSVDGVHLGHNLPDGRGSRYCINLVCVAGIGHAHVE